MKNSAKSLRRAAATLCLICVLSAAAGAQATSNKKVRELRLGETLIKVNVYEKAGGAAVTFFAPHHDERTAGLTAREAVERRGGRLVEIESLDDAGRPARRLRFTVGGKPHSVDPNRIYTDNGRRCASQGPEADAAVKSFADALLKIILPPEARGPRFVVAVHNNIDFDSKSPKDRAGDLTASAYARTARLEATPPGGFHESAAGVYLSNAEGDADNFVIVSAARLMPHFAGVGFNVVVQRPAADLRGERCGVDDGSFSVYAAQQDILYVCLEADALGGAERQRQMLEAVYDLLPRLSEMSAK